MHKNHSAHILLTYIYGMYFAHNIDFFALSILKKKIQIHHVLVLFGATPGVDSCSRQFEAINK